MQKIEQQAISAIRVLAADAIQKAKSGHPGMPIGAAPMAYALWKQMKHNPKNPTWAGRDRFVLSAGHASMLEYALLHLYGYGLTAEDLKNFRQVGSLTPGHPEFGHTVGVEATTGPLGQGFAMAVGMAMAEAHMAAKFNKEGYNVVDNYTFVMMGDGCMMEGASAEAASLAGTQKLNKLIALTTATASPSRATPPPPLRKTWLPAMRLTAGRSSTWKTAKTTTPWALPSKQPSLKRKSPPLSS